VVRQHLDNSVAAWGNDHRSSDSTNALQALTNLGNIRIVVGLALLLVVVDLYRCRSRWPFLFLLTVLAGTEVSMLVVKDLSDGFGPRSTRLPRRSAHRFRAGTPRPQPPSTPRQRW
jgi:hypothetical protein